MAETETSSGSKSSSTESSELGEDLSSKRTEYPACCCYCCPTCIVSAATILYVVFNALHLPVVVDGDTLYT